MPSADEIRDVQRARWAGLSASWDKWDSVIMDQLRPVGEAIIEGLDLAEDHQHLDIAAGTGEPGLSIARLLPKGRVVLTDLAAEMLEVAARRARAQGVGNIETRVCSADELPFDEATLRQRVGAFRLHVLPRPGQGDRRVRPGAQAGRPALRLGLGQAQGEPMDGIAMQAIATEVRSRRRAGRAEYVPVRRPGLCQRAVRGRGLSDIAEWDVAVELVTRSPEQYWQMMSEHVSPAVAALQQVDEAAQERIRAYAIARGRARSSKDGKVAGSRPGPVHRRVHSSRQRTVEALRPAHGCLGSPA